MQATRSLGGVSPLPSSKHAKIDNGGTCSRSHLGAAAHNHAAVIHGLLSSRCSSTSQLQELNKGRK